MFTHGGSELAEKISRDSSTLGNLITRHLAEFDRTVKTYGGELVERLGVAHAGGQRRMRSYVDGFDTKVGAKATELTATLDQRLARFQDALDGRTQTLNDALSSRVMDIAKTLAEGGKEVVAALDKPHQRRQRHHQHARRPARRDVGAKIDDIDKALGTRAIEVANNLDTRIGRFEQLLIGRAETVTEQIETRTKAAADILNARMEQLAHVDQDQLCGSRAGARQRHGRGAPHHRPAHQGSRHHDRGCLVGHGQQYRDGLFRHGRTPSSRTPAKPSARSPPCRRASATC